jgi:hypothetical protein
VGLISSFPCEATPAPTAVSTPAPGESVSIACGSSSAVGSFQADAYYSGGSTYNNSNTVDVSQITDNPPPAALFNNERYGEMTYTIPGFTAGGTYAVTLYFAETYLTSSGGRVFNVSINGTAVLSNFDIYAAAGGQNRAIARGVHRHGRLERADRHPVHLNNRKSEDQRHQHPAGYSPDPGTDISIDS